MLSIGIDIGSTQTKGVILRNGKDIVKKSLLKVGTGTSSSKKILDTLLKNTDITLGDIDVIVSTGYGRKTFEQAKMQLSELSAHSLGVCNSIENVGTIIDIGGQDVKIMDISNNKLQNFVMNDKCAAGTGRFLDMMARVFELDVSELEGVAKRSKEVVTISSICTVFAESEVISHLSNGCKIEDICSGLHHSVAKRVASLSGRLEIEDNVVMSGGVAKNGDVVKWLEKELNKKIIVPKDCEFMGSIGAAVYGFSKMR